MAAGSSEIMEVAAIVNESDRAILTSPAGQTSIAEAVTRGIVAWATR